MTIKKCIIFFISSKDACEQEFFLTNLQFNQQLLLSLKDRHKRHSMAVTFTSIYKSVFIITKVENYIPAYDKVYSIQYYVIKLW